MRDVHMQYLLQNNAYFQVEMKRETESFVMIYYIVYLYTAVYKCCAILMFYLIVQ